MKRREQKGQYVSVQEAARLAQVTAETIRTWVANGHLPAKREKKVRIVYQYAILRSSLKTARQVRCKYCDRLFEARRPRKALFCCAEHRDRWRYEQMKKDAKK
ncbi:MAG: MerR family transcriptional regulator [Verrucomicrobia bacterium]|nr:MerR family transcriptional regulator [Verrucomicrobiota bacterium]